MFRVMIVKVKIGKWLLMRKSVLKGQIGPLTTLLPISENKQNR